MEIIEVSSEGIIAFSPNGNSTNLGEAEEGYDGNSYVRRRSFWEK